MVFLVATLMWLYWEQRDERYIFILRTCRWCSLLRFSRRRHRLGHAGHRAYRHQRATRSKSVLRKASESACRQATRVVHAKRGQPRPLEGHRGKLGTFQSSGDCIVSKTRVRARSVQYRFQAQLAELGGKHEASRSHARNKLRSYLDSHGPEIRTAHRA